MLLVRAPGFISDETADDGPSAQPIEHHMSVRFCVNRCLNWPSTFKYVDDDHVVGVDDPYTVGTPRQFKLTLRFKSVGARPWSEEERCKVAAAFARSTGWKVTRSPLYTRVLKML